jgi:hypothetical protein
MVSSKVIYSAISVLVLFSGLFSVVLASDSLYAQGSNQTAGNQTAGNQTAGNQTAGNQTGEGLQAVGNKTGEALKGAQEFFNQGGEQGQ